MHQTEAELKVDADKDNGHKDYGPIRFKHLSFPYYVLGVVNLGYTAILFDADVYFSRTRSPIFLTFQRWCLRTTLASCAWSLPPSELAPIPAAAFRDCCPAISHERSCKCGLTCRSSFSTHGMAKQSLWLCELPCIYAHAEQTGIYFAECHCPGDRCCKISSTELSCCVKGTWKELGSCLSCNPSAT